MVAQSRTGRPAITRNETAVAGAATDTMMASEASNATAIATPTARTVSSPTNLAIRGTRSETKYIEERADT